MSHILNILIIDDDVDMLDSLVKTFNKKHADNVNITSRNNSDGIAQLFHENTFDFVLLDLAMPDKDGATLCKEIKAICNIPVIIMSALCDPAERVATLRLGADDFIDKPINTDELLARARAIIKRYKATSSDIKRPEDYRYAFGAWLLDAAKMKLVCQQTQLVVPISVSDYNLLLLFLNNNQRILQREFISEALQNKKREFYDRSIDVRVSLLRKKIESDPQHPIYIKTIHGKGYLFNAEVDKKEKSAVNESE